MVTALGPGVTVTHKMWSVTGGSNFDWKNFGICIDGRLWEVVAHEWWAHMEVCWLYILGCLAYMSYIEKVWSDVRTAREAQGYKWLRVLNFSLGFHFLLLSKPSLSTKQWCWESYSWFFLLFFLLLIQWNFRLYALPHYLAWQMKHWRQCLYPWAPEPADCAAVLGFLHKIRPCTADVWRYPTSRTR